MERDGVWLGVMLEALDDCNTLRVVPEVQHDGMKKVG